MRAYTLTFGFLVFFFFFWLVSILTIVTQYYTHAVGLCNISVSYADWKSSTYRNICYSSPFIPNLNFNLVGWIFSQPDTMICFRHGSVISYGFLDSEYSAIIWIYFFKLLGLIGKLVRPPDILYEKLASLVYKGEKFRCKWVNWCGSWIISTALIYK